MGSPGARISSIPIRKIMKALDGRCVKALDKGHDEIDGMIEISPINNSIVCMRILIERRSRTAQRVALERIS